MEFYPFQNLPVKVLKGTLHVLFVSLIKILFKNDNCSFITVIDEPTKVDTLTYAMINSLQDLYYIYITQLNYTFATTRISEFRINFVLYFCQPFNVLIQISM